MSITSSGATPLNWTATVTENSPWVSLSATRGTTPATISLSLVGWRAESQPAGEYSGRITINAEGVAPATVDVTWTVVAKLPGPKFTYFSGPQGCTQPPGYADAATCQVPNEKPPGNFAPPGIGQTYIDPNFGAQVKILSETQFVHIYSAVSAASASGKYLMVQDNRDGRQFVISASTGRRIHSGFAEANASVFWDAVDDEVYYYLAESTIRKGDVRTGRSTILVNYATDGHGFNLIRNGGTGDSSKDNWVSFWAPNQRQVCAVDLMRVRTYCADYPAADSPLGFRFIDFTLISKGVDSQSGKRYVLLLGEPAMGVYSVNTAAGRLDLEYRGPEHPERRGNQNGTCDPGEACLGAPHGDTFEDAAGIQYLVEAESDTDTPCERALVTYQLNKGILLRQPAEIGGGRKTILTIAKCGITWPATHVGCSRSSPFCVVSTTNPTNRNPADQTPINRTPHLSEVFVMRGNGDEIRRLAQTRSVQFTNDNYWSQPRACISSDGSFVVFTSNFGVPDAHRVVRVETGFAGVRIGRAVNAASLTASLAPGALVTLEGSGLANCTANAPAGALPETLCGARVTFNAQTGRLLYTSPEQLNVMAPRTLLPQGEVRVVATREGGEGSGTTLVAASNFGEVAPGIFSYSLDDGIARAVIQNSDLTLNGPSQGQNIRPGRLGEVQVLYANGFGLTDVTVADGEPSPADPLARTAKPTEVYIDDVPQTVLFSGLAPFLQGVFQVNFIVNNDTPMKPPGENRVWVSVNGVDSPRLSITLSN